jgi:DNA invertase Pin-like site-specific DNA recombinase
LYARVSSKDQATEGFSIPAQLGLLRTYPACRTILVEKTDRLYRNFSDYVAIDELGVEVHFVKEGVVLSQDSRSHEKFMHGIKVLMAKNYVDNLSEETRKGMLEKAREGIWPSYAPLGYKNVVGADDKRTIIPDPDLAPIIRQMYERYATGRYTLDQMVELAHMDGLAYRKSGAPVPKSTMHKILRNRIYSGDFDFDGTTYTGKYEPIISRELWNQVQSVLARRGARKTRKVKDQLPFSGLLTLRPLRLRAGRRY